MGAANVAIDVARTATRCSTSGSVYVLSGRQDIMPASAEKSGKAEEENHDELRLGPKKY
ncbi:MAG: hypothetical protein ACLTLQ_06320 [[Clostridium] scindens]